MTADPFAISTARRDEHAALDAFVVAHPRATAYHRPAMVEVLRREGQVAVETFVARAGGAAGPIAGVLPVALTQSRLFGVYATSLPFVNYGGVVADDPAAARALVDGAWAWARARGARHLILRHTGDRPLALPASTGKVTLTRALPATRDLLWSAIGSNQRNRTRKAERAGFSVTTGTDAPAVAGFHRVWSENMRDLGTPALRPSFFHALVRDLPGAEVHLVRGRGGIIAGAALTVRFRDRVEVPWSSTLRRYNAYAVNMLLYWHLLEHARAGGARVFDFGRSTPDSGTYKFKVQWGGAPEPLPWYFIAPEGRAPAGDLSPHNPRFALAIRLWQRLPVGVARVLGGAIAGHLP